MDILKSIKQEIETGDFEKALELCDSGLNDHPGSEVEILRKKASVLSLLDRREEASQIWRTIFADGGQNLSDLYLYAENFMYLGDYKSSCKTFLDLIDESNNKNEPWFLSSASFLLAFCYFKNGDFQKAMDFIAIVRELEPECEMLVPNEGVMRVGELESLVKKSIR